MGLAPSHDRFTTKARIATDNNLHGRPPLTNLPDDALQLFDTTSRTIDIGWPQPCTEQMLAAEDVQRQIAIIFVIPMKEAARLVAMQWIVRGVQVQDDSFRRLVVGLQEQRSE